MSEMARAVRLDRRSVLQLAGGAIAFVATARLNGVAGALGVPNGGLLQPADANGWRLLEGFTSRRVALTGAEVANTGHTWHADPDGGAVFPGADGGWIYVSNSEGDAGQGGVGAISFAADGSIIGAQTLLSGTTRNCAGGATPWGTWLSCEETPDGLVYECDPTGVNPPVARPAMGAFQHEAVAAAPNWRALFLTEDRPDGVLYRFTPTTWGDLSSGTLQVLADDGAGGLRWATVPNPTGTNPRPHLQVADAIRFDGAEGIDYIDSTIYFTTKGDNRIWELDLRTTTLSVLYDAAVSPNPQLTGPDNLVITPQGDVLVVEDGGNLEIVLVTRAGEVTVIGRYEGDPNSELTGPAFDPSGTRLYVSSQRLPGETFEISGPFAGEPPIALARFENDHPDLTYTGDWFTWTNASQSGGSAAVARGVGARLSFTFSGPAVRIIGQRGPQRGVMRFSVDGGELATVDTYAPTWQSQVVLADVAGLADGDHDVLVEYLGPGPDAQGSGVLLIDAVEAEALVAAPPVEELVRFENDDPALEYSGSWFTWTNASQSGGSAAIGRAGSSMTVDFTGSAIRWIGQRGPARAQAAVWIDGANPTLVDTYAPTYASQSVLFEATGLPDGTKRLRIEHFGANDAAVGTPVIVVDAIEAAAVITPAPPPTVVSYENTDPRLRYDGSWFRWSNPDQSGGSSEVTSMVGASCSFTVDGPSLRWYGQAGPARGIAEIYVDGLLVATQDCFDLVYRSNWLLWTTDGLGPGLHEVEIRHAGANEVAIGNPAILIDRLEATALI